MVSARAAARAVARRSPWYLQNTLILGAGDVGQTIARKLLQHPEYGINLVGFVDDRPKERRDDLGNLTVVGGSSDLREVVQALDVERVIVAFSGDSDADTLHLIRTLNDLDVQVDVVPRLYELVSPGVGLHTVQGIPLVGLPQLSLSSSSQLMKRLLDVAVSSIALAILAPFFLVIAAAIKLDSRGPAFFRQTRMGSGGKPFTILKFRTMACDAEERKHEIAHLNQHRGGDERMFKAPCRPSGNTGRSLPASHLDRRAPATGERTARRDEPRRPAAIDPRGGQLRPRVGARAAADQARHHRPLAGSRPQRHPVWRDGAAGLPLRHLVVARRRRQDRREDNPARPSFSIDDVDQHAHSAENRR